MTFDAGTHDLVLAAMADPTRRQILEILAIRRQATATTVAAQLPVTRQAVAKHLGLLAGAGLVAGHRDGREVLYSVRTEQLNAAACWLEATATRWTALQGHAVIGERAEDPDDAPRAAAQASDQQPVTGRPDPYATGGRWIPQWSPATPFWTRTAALWAPRVRRRWTRASAWSLWTARRLTDSLGRARSG